MAYKISEDCAACGTCIDECPVGAISAGDIYKIDPNMCTDCGTCAAACPVGTVQELKEPILNGLALFLLTISKVMLIFVIYFKCVLIQ